MLVLDISNKTELESFSSESVSFDKNKIRDDNFRKKIEEQLTKIDSVFEDNSFYAFRKNKHLYNELVELYKNNLIEYEQKYLGTLEQFNNLKNEIEKNKNNIHKAHYASFDFKPIENLLAVTKYDSNTEAIPLIEKLEQTLKNYVTQYRKLKNELAVFKTLIEENKSTVWLEKIEDWNSEYRTYEKELLSDSLPHKSFKLKSELIDQESVRKTKKIQNLADELQGRYAEQDSVETFLKKEVLEKDFDKFAKPLRKGILGRKKEKKVIRFSVLILIMGFIIYSLFIDRLIREIQTFNQARHENTSQSYERYLLDDGVGFNDFWRNSLLEQSFYGVYRNQAIEAIEKLEKIIVRYKNHSRSVNSVAFVPKANLVLSGSSDKTMHLWDSNTGDLLNIFEGHLGEVKSVAISPDSKTALSGLYSTENIMILWDLQSGKEIRTFKAERGHLNDVKSIKFSPDGKSALSMGGEKTGRIKLWDISNGETVRVFKGLKNDSYRYRSISLSPSGKVLASIYGWKEIILCSITGRKLRTLSMDDTYFSSIDFSSNGKFLISGAENGTMYLWKINNGNEVASYKLPEMSRSEISCIKFMPDGKKFVAGTEHGRIFMFDVESGEIIRTFIGHDSHRRITSVDFSQNGKKMVSSSEDHSAIVWDITNPRILHD